MGFTANHNFPILDLTMPDLRVIDRIVDLVEDYAEQGVVYVHCKIGYSRSVAVVAAYLLRTQQAVCAKDAVDFIRARRPEVVVRPEIWRMLEQYQQFLANR